MPVLSFWGALRRSLTSKDKKSRDWNHLCLMVSFVSAAIFIIVLNGISILFFVLIAAQGIYFYIFWPGYNYTILRTCLLLVVIPINLALVWIRLSLLREISAATVDPSRSRDRGADLTDDKILEQYEFQMKGMRKVGWMIAVSSLLLAIVQLGAAAFWLWLLPSRHRLPNRYEPVILTKGPSLTAIHEPDSIELEILPTADSSSRLEAIFKDHENARVLKLLPSSIGAPSATRRRHVGQSSQVAQRGSNRPKLAPGVRYWMLSNAESELKFWVIAMAVFIRINIGFEIPIYTILRANNLRCPWHCHAGLVHPVVFGLWLVAFVVLLIRRVAFDTRIFKIIRLDLLLLITYCMSWAFWLVVHIPRYFSPSQDKRDYQESLRNTPLSHPYEIAGSLQAVGTALCTVFGFALVVMAGVGLYQDSNSRRLSFV
ncbi:hypothetical protein F5Y03DRAFT_402440 [Xylaria venustula]|nr:hypothetical protein F5Y03DRAFT_402440 [Xylaria venustula]